MAMLMAGAPAAPDGRESVRSWTSIGGNAVEAGFVSLQSGQVHLRTADGQDIRIDMSRLSEDDKEFVRSRSGGSASKKRAAVGVEGTYKGTYREGGWSGALDCVLTGAAGGELTAAFAAVHSDGKTYNYRGTLAPKDGGKFEGLFDVRRPKEFRVSGSFAGPVFMGAIALVEENGQERASGELSMTRVETGASEK